MFVHDSVGKKLCSAKAAASETGGVAGWSMRKWTPVRDIPLDDVTAGGWSGV
jgi:hypothetical protein